MAGRILTQEDQGDNEENRNKGSIISGDIIDIVGDVIGEIIGGIFD